MPEILNRHNQKVTLQLGGGKSIQLPPKGRVSVSEKEADSHSVAEARDAHKIVILADAEKKKSSSKSEE